MARRPSHLAALGVDEEIFMQNRAFERGIDDYMKLLENYWDGVQARVLGLAPS